MPKKPKTPDKNIIAFEYVTSTWVSGPTIIGSADTHATEFNKAWGFKNGACNKKVKGVIVGKPEPEGFYDAWLRMSRGMQVELKITVFKDGHKTVEIYDPEDAIG